jgi:hypothetical protein
VQIDPIDPKKALDKYDPDNINIPKKELLPEEELFKETYLEHGNATACYQKVFPEKCAKLKPMDIRARASNLVKKLMIKGKTKEKIKLKNRRDSHNQDIKMVDYLKKQYELGMLSEEDMYKRMDDLSRLSTSDQTRFNATKEMRQWVREAKSEIEANKLSALEVVPLMVDALTEIPKSKYIQILAGVRKTRARINRERMIEYDPDTIRNAQRSDVMYRGKN